MHFPTAFFLRLAWEWTISNNAGDHVQGVGTNHYLGLREGVIIRDSILAGLICARTATFTCWLAVNSIRVTISWRAMRPEAEHVDSTPSRDI